MGEVIGIKSYYKFTIPPFPELMRLKDTVPHTLENGNRMLDLFIERIAGSKKDLKELAETWTDVRGEVIGLSKPKVCSFFDNVYFFRFVEKMFSTDAAREAMSYLNIENEAPQSTMFSALGGILRRFL